MSHPVRELLCSDKVYAHNPLLLQSLLHQRGSAIGGHGAQCGRSGRENRGGTPRGQRRATYLFRNGPERRVGFCTDKPL